MIGSDFKQFKKLCRRGTVIALSENLPADLETPVSSFLKVAAGEDHAFLLESAEQGEKVGRYSIIGFHPERIYQSDARGTTVLQEGRKLRDIAQDTPFLEILRQDLKGFRLSNPEALPGFAGGFVGFLSYECVEEFETIQLSAKKGAGIPRAVFYLTRDLLIFDHFRKTISIVSFVFYRPNKDLRKQYSAGIRRIQTIHRQLLKPLLPPHRKKYHAKSTALISNIKPSEFKNKVKRIKEYIRAGDCIQVVFSQRFSLPAAENDFQIYRSLRSINPSPYMFYFRCGKIRLIGSSPELLVKKTGRLAEVRPIAGTRPRGATPQQDAAYEENLKRSPKEMAEHLMLVDLGRNDLGRVSEFNSIKVTHFARTERYSHVMHLVSDVSGKLKPGKDAFDLLRVTFPAGTVSGAPKIRAMQIIDELEPEARGPYAGCLGYFSFNQDMEMCITIRTLVINGKLMHLQAGAGIVKDSNPRNEFQETVNKASALFKAVQMRDQF